MPASEKEMGDLHALLAKTFTTMLKMEDPPPALLNAAAKFLKDNDITVVAEFSDGMKELEDELQQAMVDEMPDGVLPIRKAE